MTFHLMCVHIIFSSVWVDEWSSFGKELLSRLTICLERFPLPLGAWDGLRYFIVALPEPSI